MCWGGVVEAVRCCCCVQPGRGSQQKKSRLTVKKMKTQKDWGTMWTWSGWGGGG